MKLFFKQAILKLQKHFLIHHLTKQGWKKVAFLEEGTEIATQNSTMQDNLFLLDSNQNNQSNGDDQQRAKDVKISHNVSDIIHNDSFVNNKLNIQQMEDSKSPVIAKNQFADLFTTGSMSIEAKNTCPMSRVISDKVLNLEEDNSIQFIIADKKVMSRWEKIVSIEQLPAEQIYDIEVEGTHNFVANGIIAHNTYISSNVGIGTTASAEKLSVVGNIEASIAGLFKGSFNPTSGIRLYFYLKK